MLVWWLSCSHHDPAPEAALNESGSAYVRAHAGDSVPWQTWGPAAFEQARRGGRLVFVTVGYASCHWCHVMQHESFSDPEVARVLGGSFVPIVVDREERPDVDQVALAAVRALGGRPGWPTTLVLTPEGEVVFAGGYLPARDGDRGAGIGLLTVLLRLQDAWLADRAGLVASAQANSRLLREAASPGPPPAVQSLSPVLERFRAAFDPEHGGFGGAPKFPQPALLRLVLDQAALTGEPAWLEMSVATARAMAASGLRDPIGAGFHRYTVDAAWEVPHFEKITADNAALAAWYVDVGLAAGDPELVSVGRETLAALSAFAAPHGGYGVALDASGVGDDGSPIEGLYYTWTTEELTRLGAQGQWRVLGAPAKGRSLVVPAPVDLERFRAARAARPPPRLDDQWLVATNATVVSALVRIGAATGARDELARALDLASQLARDGLDGQDGVRHAASGGLGMLEDYALLVHAWLDLFEVTADPHRLSQAIALMEGVERRFADPAGGWFRAEEATLALRLHDASDPSGPSGASAAVSACLRLAGLTGDPKWLARADRALERWSPSTAMPAMVEAALLRARAPLELVIAWPPGADPGPLMAVVQSRVLPGRILVQGSNAQLAALSTAVPLTAGKVAAGAPTVWLCRGGVCELPRTDPAALAVALHP